MSRNGQIGHVPRVIYALIACGFGAQTAGSARAQTGAAAGSSEPARQSVEAAQPEAAAAAPRGSLVLPVSPAELAALQALGPDIRVFTARARPLRELAELRQPGEEVGSADLELARGVMALLRAGGVRFPGGAHDVMTLTSDNQLPSLFTRRKNLRLFLLRARPDGAERVIVDRGGGVPLAFRVTGSNQLVAAPVPARGRPSLKGASAERRTSFGPIRRVERASTARHRSWQRASAQVHDRHPRRGNQFLIVHIDRDFAAGLGKVAYLFGSGVILEPDFTQLVLLDGSRRHPPSAIYADGPALELAYEIPVNARNLRLEDGDLRLPLSESLAAR
jgi:hypothetical protein